MKIPMPNNSIVELILEYEYKDIKVSGNTPLEVIKKLNKKMDNKLPLRDQYLILNDVARQTNEFLRMKIGCRIMKLSKYENYGVPIFN